MDYCSDNCSFPGTVHFRTVNSFLTSFVSGLEAISEGGNLIIRTYKDGDKVILLIQDEGQGVDPDVLENIGKPFLTTKAHGQD